MYVLLFEIAYVRYLYSTCVYFNFGYLMPFHVFSNEWTEKKPTQKEKSTCKTQSVNRMREEKKSVLGKLPHLRWHSQMLRNHWNVLGNKMNAYSTFFCSFSLVCVFFLFCSAALMLCSGDWCFIYTVCSMVVSNGFITCSYQCMYPFAICVHCTPRYL